MKFLMKDLAIGIAIGAGIGHTTGNFPVGVGGDLVLGLAMNFKRQRKTVR